MVVGAEEQLESSETSSPPPIEKVFAIKNSKGNDSHNMGRILPPRVITAVDLKKLVEDTGSKINYLKSVLESYVEFFL